MESENKQFDYLTLGEFCRWVEDDRLFKERVLDELCGLREDRDAHGVKIAVLETDLLNVKSSTRATTLKWGAGLTTALTMIIQVIWDALTKR